MHPVKKAKKREEYGYYLVEIGAWSFAYGLSAHPVRWDEDPVFERTAVEVTGRLLGPISSRCSAAAISLAVSADMGRAARIAAGPERHRSVGYIEKRGEVLTGQVALSGEVMGHLLTLFAADRLRMLLLYGPRLFRGKALVRSVSVETTLNPEEYPTDY